MKNLKRILLLLAFTVLVSALAFSAGQRESVDTLSFAGSGGYPPFNFMTDAGEVIGFDVDVAEEIASRLGKVLDYRTTAWDGIIEGLRAGRYDGILGSMGITPQRQEVVDFSTPYYYSGPQLIVRENSGISGPEDLDSSSVIALVTGTTFEEDANQLGVRVSLYEDDNQTLMELLNGRVDGVLTDRIVGLNAIDALPRGEELILVGSVLRTEKMGVVVQKGNDELLSQINQALEDMRADGTMLAISEKWFGEGVDITVE